MEPHDPLSIGQHIDLMRWERELRKDDRILDQYGQYNYDGALARKIGAFAARWFYPFKYRRGQMDDAPASMLPDTHGPREPEFGPMYMVDPPDVRDEDDLNQA